MKENSLLNEQLENYQSLNKSLVEIDSLRVKQLDNQIKLNYDLYKEIDKKNKVIRIGGITFGIGLILLLLWK